ncbi:Rrf2 family transcriptional regulator [Staphylococcus caeli]|uniref:Rrf2 family transcriptional regulator n=1 Tax=Staphylococcus caeli TaxID=2201815 RepID=A0A1D4M144_9STAP|nr:Rrf2 family transcriptional regulator [Staphylococcus caeli]SCS82075.1 Rrf2 family transcriptional regulator [Staphylococcus caeli]SCS92198.1 Rrf2 family transcriptional regulator [Staphylococcus caeli]
MNTQFSVSIHILTLLATEKEPVSSQYIADSINSNATLVRKLCRYLRNGQIIQSSQGISGYRLARPASEINLGDVYQLIFAETSHFAKIHKDTNPQCYVGKHISQTLDSIFNEVDETIINKLNTYTIQGVIERF